MSLDPGNSVSCRCVVIKNTDSKAPSVTRQSQTSPYECSPEKGVPGRLPPGPLACLDVSVTINVSSALLVLSPRTRKRWTEEENPLVLAEMKNEMPHLRRSAGREEEAPQRRGHPSNEAQCTPEM